MVSATGKLKKKNLFRYRHIAYIGLNLYDKFGLAKGCWQLKIDNRMHLLIEILTSENVSIFNGTIPAFSEGGC